MVYFVSKTVDGERLKMPLRLAEDEVFIASLGVVRRRGRCLSDFRHDKSEGGSYYGQDVHAEFFYTLVNMKGTPEKIGMWLQAAIDEEDAAYKYFDAQRRKLVLEKDCYCKMASRLDADLDYYVGCMECCDSNEGIDSLDDEIKSAKLRCSELIELELRYDYWKETGYTYLVWEQNSKDRRR